jgi:hypothetical protein
MASFRPPRRRGVASFAFAAGLVFLSAWPSRLNAQQPTQGFAVERFYPSAPGGGWFVMDDLNISGGLGGAISLTGGYARNPFEVTSSGGAQRLDLVSGESFVDIGAAVTYDRFRFYLNIPLPLTVTGNSGTLGQYQLTAPSLSLGANPDTISDPRIGFDARLYGKPGSLLRLGASAQLIFPSGDRADYVSDARYRAMLRFLAAGDAGRFSYAGQFGLHLRPVEGSLPPGGPNGNELLFGASVGRRFTVRDGWDAVLGPEFYGESAVHSNYTGQTGFEGLLTARLERTGDRPHLRFKLGLGHGLVQNFGAPQWRVLASVELVGQRPANSASKP